MCTYLFRKCLQWVYKKTASSHEHNWKWFWPDGHHTHTPHQCCWHATEKCWQKCTKPVFNGSQFTMQMKDRKAQQAMLKPPQPRWCFRPKICCILRLDSADVWNRINRKRKLLLMTISAYKWVCGQRNSHDPWYSWIKQYSVRKTNSTVILWPPSL